MAFSNNLTITDYVVQRLIEQQNIYSYCNRSFDDMVKPGATAVLIPKLAIPVVRTVGTTTTATERKNAHADTSMVTISLSPSAVPLATELIAIYEGGGNLPTEYLQSAAMVLGEAFDTNILTEAQTTTNTDTMAGSVLSWADITTIKKKFVQNKVPKDKMVMVVDADLIDQFLSIDVIKQTVAFNPNYLETGEFGTILGMRTFVSALVPKIGGKATITTFSGYGLGFILNRMGEVKERYDEENMKDITDMLAHSGQELFDVKFAHTMVAQ